MAPPPLLGPPELYAPIPPRQLQPATGDAFIDLMLADFNDIKEEEPDNTAKNPCLDFFFQVVPGIGQYIDNLLCAAWDHDPLKTLKLICNLRGVRGNGKSDKESFYQAVEWLHELHPKTLACNLTSIAEFGYFKDFPEILYRILNGFDIRRIQKAQWKSGPVSGFRHRRPFGKNKKRQNSDEKPKKKPVVKRISAARKEVRKAYVDKWTKLEKEKCSLGRQERKIAMAKKVLERYAHDPDFRYLYERVSDLFADYLKNDMSLIKSGELKKISLVAKWCPSIDSSFDRATLLCESIAKKIFPRDEFPEYEGVEDAHYLYRVRDRLRKEVLVPIHKLLELPEVFMGANRFDILPYGRVASIAMKNYKDRFQKHDSERFTKYLEDVMSGKAKIAAGALLPHEIIKSLDDNDGGEVAELQWKRMIDDLSQKGKIKNCMAICGVSGMMQGKPMEVSMSLGILVSELSEQPWKGKLITFSENPKLRMVEGDNLLEKTEVMRYMEVGTSLNFRKVFDLILRVAVNGKLKEEEMIKRLFVFSDMDFDVVSSPEVKKTDYEAIVKKFDEKGYKVPEIVFWNVKNSRSPSMPVKRNEKGVALVSGFSKNLMKLFLDGEGEIDPLAVMEMAIAGDEYNKLVVMD